MLKLIAQQTEQIGVFHLIFECLRYKPQKPGYKFVFKHKLSAQMKYKNLSLHNKMKIIDFSKSLAGCRKVSEHTTLEKQLLPTF